MMIVVGIDPHTKTHTAAALDSATGVLVDEITVECTAAGRDGLLVWARGLAAERVFAIEDCRHVSGRLEREIRGHMRVLAPELMEVAGCSALSAAQLVEQVAGAYRFRSEAVFAMHVGTAPLAVSSGKSDRHRLNRTGNRCLNSTIHVVAVTQVRMHPPAIAFVERRRAEGMSTREALRCLKRYIIRTLYKTMVRAERARSDGVVHVDFEPAPVAAAV